MKPQIVVWTRANTENLNVGPITVVTLLKSMATLARTEFVSLHKFSQSITKCRESLVWEKFTTKCTRYVQATSFIWFAFFRIKNSFYHSKKIVKYIVKLITSGMSKTIKLFLYFWWQKISSHNARNNCKCKQSELSKNFLC